MDSTGIQRRDPSTRHRDTGMGAIIFTERNGGPFICVGGPDFLGVVKRGTISFTESKGGRIF